MKSRLDDFCGVEWRSSKTSLDVTVVMTENRSPEWVGSDNGGGRLNWVNFDPTPLSTHTFSTQRSLNGFNSDY